MYNKKGGYWKSDLYNDTMIKWSNAFENKDDPNAMFVRADILLESSKEGAGNVEAVYLMEEAAKKGNSSAAMAMAEMFRYGWAVHKNHKLSMYWYEEAAKLGHPEAIKYLMEIKRHRKRMVLGITGVTLIIAAIVVALIFVLPKFMPVKGIKVSAETEYIQEDDFVEFTKLLNEIAAEYDDEDVISNEKRSLRLIVEFEGEGIDLSDFKAEKVISTADNFVIIQFSSEKETDRCIAALKKMKNVLHVSEDKYKKIGSKSNESPIKTASTTSSVYKSPHTGFDYFTWGVEFMAVDELVAWTLKQQQSPVVVTVIDTGSEPCEANIDRYKTGIDLVDTANPNGWGDHDGHGTHVAGTILDCTQGLNVSVFPIRVLGPNGGLDSVIAMAIKIAISIDSDVINMSLGGPCTAAAPEEDCGGAIDYYVRQAVAEGIVTCVAAGNGDAYGNPIDSATECPAHIGDAIVVAACMSNGELASFSNYGDSIDVCAPGVDVVSYYVGNTYAALNGTSMACPHISAIIAILKSAEPNRSYTPAEIELILTDYCIDMGNEQYYGEGIPLASLFAGK